MNYTADETQDYYPDESDFPTDRRRFCFEHGYEPCSGESIECEVLEEKEAA
jgi:hypothetical protein